MGKYRKILIALMATVFAFSMIAFTACGNKDDEKGDVTIKLDQTALTLKEGASDTLTATVEGSDEAVVWTATPNDGTVITIAGSGKTCTVTAVAPGTAKVTASVGGESAECSVTVNKDEEQGGDDDLPKITEWTKVDNAIYSPETVNGVDYIWHHLFFNDIDAKAYDFDGYEATVKLDGVAGEIVESLFDASAAKDHAYHMQIRIKGNKYQQTEFTINFKKGEETVAIGTYTREGDKEILLNPSRLTISAGETGTVSIASVNGSTDYSDLTVTWAIDDTSVATIPENSDGTSVEVTAVAEGEATITVTIDGITQTCKVTVGEVEDYEITNYELLEAYGAPPAGQYFKIKVVLNDDNKDKLAEIKEDFSKVLVDGEQKIPGAPGQFFSVGAEYYELHVPVANAVDGTTYAITLVDAGNTVLAVINFTYNAPQE